MFALRDTQIEAHTRAVLEKFGLLRRHAHVADR
jgi:hypothetical protein